MLHEWGSCVRKGEIFCRGLQMRKQEKINKDDVHYANFQMGKKFLKKRKTRRGQA